MSFIRTKAQSYKQVFAGEQAKRVLGDLARFCHMTNTAHVTGDPTGSALLEGRRQVFLRIQAMCGLTGEQITGWENTVKEEEWGEND